MQIIIFNGNTKKGGFIAGALQIVADCLESRGVHVDSIFLADAHIKDCVGCFHCLKTGQCIQQDDMADILDRMCRADGFVIGSPVRNGLMTACYKRFYERITYTLGFPLLLEDKHTLAISCVGMMGGKAVNRKFLGLQDVFHTRLSDYIFCKVGIPTQVKPADMTQRLENAAARLVQNIDARQPKSLPTRASAALDRFILKRFALQKSPAVYAAVIDSWRKKGYIA